MSAKHIASAALIALVVVAIVGHSSTLKGLAGF